MHHEREIKEKGKANKAKAMVTLQLVPTTPAKAGLKASRRQAMRKLISRSSKKEADLMRKKSKEVKKMEKRKRKRKRKRKGRGRGGRGRERGRKETGSKNLL